MEADNPLAAQISYQPRASDVVQLSDVLAITTFSSQTDFAQSLTQTCSNMPSPLVQNTLDREHHCKGSFQIQNYSSLHQLHTLADP